MKFAANLNLKEHQFFFTHPVEHRKQWDFQYNEKNSDHWIMTRACSIVIPNKNVDESLHKL